MRSSPKRICGFIMPFEETTSPLDRAQRCAAMVVEPTSMASPQISSRYPGQSAMISRSRCTATVRDQLPSRSAGCRPEVTRVSQDSPVRFHCSFSASLSRVRSLLASWRRASSTSTK